MKHFFPAFVFACILFTACVDNYDAPCRDQVIAKSYTFSTAQAEVIPFSEHDTLVYAVDSTDILYMRTAAYVDSFTTKITDVPNNPECPNDFESHQVISSRIKDTLSTFELAYRAEEPSGKCRYTVGSFVFEVALSAIGAQDSTFIDSVLLGNTMFYNVNKFTASGGSPVYIHPTLGLLQLFKDNKYYTLQRFNHKPWK